MFSVEIKKPQALKPGDRIRLVAPASPFDPKLLKAGMEAIKKMGYVPVMERSEFKRTGFLTGADGERAQRMESALLEEGTRAVWCIRGGYGTSRILPWLNLEKIRQRPKLLIGFSDITALLLSLSVPGGFITIHGPVVTQLPKLPPSARTWLKKLLEHPQPLGRVPFSGLQPVVGGKANGYLVGGNLSVLCSLVGTPYLPSLAGAILCLEDTGEEAYRLDRLFNQLVQSNVLKHVFGLVLGNLHGCKPEGHGQFSARKVLERAAAVLQVPTVSGAFFGHAPRNLALPMGVLAQLDAEQKSILLLEPAVG